jgi:glycosyltransferase involved in cell wall biosynthesis
MKIGYFIRNYVLEDANGKPAMVGGVKVVSQHVKLLNEMGHETLLLTRNMKKDLNLAEMNLYEKPILVKSEEDLPDCDLYVGTLFNDVRWLSSRGKGRVVHLCQGYEPIDYLCRIKGEILTERYSRKGILSPIRKLIDKLKFKKRVKEIEAIYALPTVKAAVSRHLVELIEKKYRQKCSLIRNGIDPNIFYPDHSRPWGENGRVKILSVGSMHIGSKNILDTLDSVKILKGKGVPVTLTRVSPHPSSASEEAGKVVDQYYMSLKEQEMAQLYRNTDIFISSSLEAEGFGLPAMEALASGVPSILTEISSYKNFGEKRDFAYFVPTHRPDKIAKGVLTFMGDREFRRKCVENGIGVAKGFTLERTKQDLADFLKGLM